MQKIQKIWNKINNYNTFCKDNKHIVKYYNKMIYKQKKKKINLIF